MFGQLGCAYPLGTFSLGVLFEEDHWDSEKSFWFIFSLVTPGILCPLSYQPGKKGPRMILNC